ncbi:MAG: hypothetical protein MAG795_00488 [Candidatus Woesearchaeota archaeon]|nr:hypothetical protein [Candidatus Woesearchaeota archaeon]
MDNISVEKGEVRLLVDTRYYGFGAVLTAAKAYLDSCWVYVDGDAADIVLVTLKPKEKEIDVDTLGFEFFNFMLGTIQNAYA